MTLGTRRSVRGGPSTDGLKEVELDEGPPFSDTPQTLGTVPVMVPTGTLPGEDEKKGGTQNLRGRLDRSPDAGKVGNTRGGVLSGNHLGRTSTQVVGPGGVPGQGLFPPSRIERRFRVG